MTNDCEALLAFYDFAAEHWKHLRTTNPIESSFATIRHRTVRSKGCLSNKTALAMIFKLAQAAEKSWRRLDGHNQLPKVIQGVKFTDGIEAAIKPTAPNSAAVLEFKSGQIAGGSEPSPYDVEMVQDGGKVLLSNKDRAVR